MNARNDKWLDEVATRLALMAIEENKNVDDVISDFVRVGINNGKCTRREGRSIKDKLTELVRHPGKDWN